MTDQAAHEAQGAIAKRVGGAGVVARVQATSPINEVGGRQEQVLVLGLEFPCCVDEVRCLRRDNVEELTWLLGLSDMGRDGVVQS